MWLVVNFYNVSSSVMRCICNITHRGQHAAGQSCYVPLERHLILLMIVNQHLH